MRHAAASRPRLAWFVVAGALALSGCFTMTDYVLDRAPCPAEFPDGSPRDCTRDIALPAGSVPASGWMCFAENQHEVPGGWMLEYTLLTDGAGGWGLALAGHANATTDRVIVQAVLVDGEGPAGAPLVMAADGAGHGFARFEVDDFSGGALVLVADAFQAGQTAPVDVRANGLYEGVAWFSYVPRDGSRIVDGIIAAETPEGPYYLPSDRDVATAEGDVRVTATRLAHFTMPAPVVGTPAANHALCTTAGLSPLLP